MRGHGRQLSPISLMPQSCLRMGRMSTAALDTLKFANRLKDAGMPSAQAEAEAQALSEALAAQAQALQADMDARFGRDLTQNELRSDSALGRLEAKMDARFAAVESKMDTRFAQVDGKLAVLQWMMGVIVAGVIALVMKSFL